MPLHVILAELKAMFHRRERWLEADHIASAFERPDLAHELSNYQTLCVDCHRPKTAKFRERM